MTAVRRSKTARKEPQKKQVAISNTGSLGLSKKRTITRVIIDAIKEYGAEVVEQRAIPDYRDGLKPVHRMTLWAMYKMGINNKGGFKKAARTVGEVIGKFHPHGDISAYGAMVGMTGTKKQGRALGWWDTRNICVPLIEGQGNWGDFVDEAAAMRYTECRLSRYSDLYMLDPDYIAVMDFVPNYDDSEKVPVVLPAKMPTVLLNGYTSIAVGVAASAPAFDFEGVRDLTIRALSGEDLTPVAITKALKPVFPYGGDCLAEKRDILEVVKNGKGSFWWAPTYEVDEARKTLIFTSVCPGLSSANTIETFLNKLAQIAEVGAVSDETDKRGVRYLVQAKRGLSHDNFERMIEKCLALSERSASYDVGMTIRKPDGSADFSASTIHEILLNWADWRIEVELKVIARLIDIQDQKLWRLETMKLAVLNLETIIKALRVKKDKEIIKVKGESVEVDAAASFLMKALKISLDQANMILDTKVRQLRSIEVAKLDAQIAAETKELKQLQRDQKVPHERAIRDLEALSKIEL